MDWLKKWQPVISTVAVVTVLVTILYGFIWGVNAILSWGINTMHLGWLIRGWVVGSFAYVAFLLYEEFEEYRRDPKMYDMFIEDEEDEH